MMKEAVDDLAATLAEAASAAGAVGGLVDSISHAVNKMEETPALEPEGTFVDYQTTMVKTAKAVAVTVQEMVRNDGSTAPPPTPHRLNVLPPSPSRSPSPTPTPMTWAVWPTS